MIRQQIPEHVIPGKRLGRHIWHDPRSRAYAVTALPQTEIKSVRHRRLVAPYDQGDLGSCTANALCGVMSTQPFAHRIRSQRTIRGVYHQETLLDDFPGTWPPTDTGSSGLAAAKVAKARGWIDHYDHAFSFDALLTALQDQAVMVGITWLTGCDSPDANGIVRWTGKPRGGHEIEADEVDVERELIGFDQSWGAWGLAGRFYLPFADAEKSLDDGGDVTVPRA